tara:strand:- start:295 stop:459 length:165 start_codon:yes stop_codon:yes gene_type:complete
MKHWPLEPENQSVGSVGGLIMMDGGMFWGMGIWGLLILLLVVLAIAALVKYLRK